MQDVGGVGGSRPLTPEERQRYHEDYQKSLDLFENAFTEYNKPNVEYHKKAQLKKVMDEALQVMNETACAALKEGKQSQETALENDYDAYLENPNEANKQKLLSDIKTLKEE